MNLTGSQSQRIRRGLEALIYPANIREYLPEKTAGIPPVCQKRILSLAEKYPFLIRSIMAAAALAV